MALKKIQLSDHFTASKLLLFSLPSIGMQLVDNSYQVADGFFISNYFNFFYSFHFFSKFFFYFIQRFFHFFSFFFNFFE